MPKIILWGPGEASKYDSRRAAELIAVLAFSQGMCAACGWALMPDELFRGCPQCGSVYWKDFEEGLILWGGEDAD